MLSAEQNELLTWLGPGTKMGALMRRYWPPIAAAEELKDRWPYYSPVAHNIFLKSEKFCRRSQNLFPRLEGQSTFCRRPRLPELTVHTARANLAQKAIMKLMFVE